MARADNLSKPLSESFLSVVLATLLVAGLLSVIEQGFGKRSALSLYFVIVLSILLTRPEFLGRISQLIERINPSG